MKKIIFSILFALIILPSVFAETDDYDFEETSEKNFGISAGVRLSTLGLEPVISLNLNHLEIDTACSVSTGFDGREFGFAPSLAVGYCSSPFTKGYSTTFGLEYYYLSPSYTHLVNSFFNSSDAKDMSIHAASLFYKGAVHFNKNFGLMWRARLPLFIAGDDQFYVITNLHGVLVCWLTGVATLSVGVNFSF